MNDPQTIQELMNYIAERYAFTEEKYPELRLLDEQGRYAFAVRHLGIHFAKTAGKIVTVSEAVDHGGAIDEESLKVDVAKSLLSTLRLAELLHMNTDDLVSRIKQYVK